ncbi:DUF998 domain-containing protein [Jiangella ureilytica]|uniref:DUF998 domain-containing protein n=1 Tax=Jiangella ureilytica TaxID=2530374 RepID=A0A4V2XX42_9ACTN|nr:DUF998 domain-containing protein [Jiangella ureilytica]TDC51755.1 DUF998 domain-containing protein [Jiangella ureilytica]
MTTLAAPHAGVRSVATTRTLIGALAVSGPLWAVVSLAQAATRDAFDLSRHPLSMLAVGSLGWIQIANFVVAGLLMIAGAAGVKRATTSTWAPRLVLTYGVGYVLAGVFVMQPGAGFPAGTPDDVTEELAWHTVVHLFAGTVAFAALTAALFVLGRYFARREERGPARAARIAAVVVIVANVLSSAQVFAPSAVLAAGVIAGMLVLSLLAVRLRREA